MSNTIRAYDADTYAQVTDAEKVAKLEQLKEAVVAALAALTAYTQEHKLDANLNLDLLTGSYGDTLNLSFAPKPAKAADEDWQDSYDDPTAGTWNASTGG